MSVTDRLNKCEAAARQIPPEDDSEIDLSALTVDELRTLHAVRSKAIDKPDGSLDFSALTDDELLAWERILLNTRKVNK